MDAPVIPGYEILAPLPQGGMSAVFKARQLSLDRLVVLKILPPSMAIDGVDTGLLLAEAKIMAQLKHPNMIQIYDFGKAPDGSYYFIMEFVSGYSVADWIRRKKTLAAKDTLLCAHCVAEALDYAWGSCGIVHCDIKPDNVMIDGDGTVKVADLGLARSVRSVMDVAKFPAGVVIGTPYYIAPEQSQGRRDLDCRTDIYSLGAMMYHCLTGKMPFEGLPPLDIMDCQITDSIPDLVEIQPQASMATACLVEKMMAKNPDHRQKDWPEVIGDLIRARSEMLPKNPLPPEGASTMRRCEARARFLREIKIAPDAAPAPASDLSAPVLSAAAGRPPALFSGTLSAGVIAGIWRRIRSERPAVAIAALALAVLGLLALHLTIKPESSASPTAGRLGRRAGDASAPSDLPAPVNGITPIVAEPSSEPGADDESVIAGRLEAALQWHRDHPGQYNEAIRKLAQIAEESQDARYARMAAKEIAQIQKQQHAGQAAVMKDLFGKVQPLLDRENWLKAARIFEEYEGAFMSETESQRKAKIREWSELNQDQQAGKLQLAEARKREQMRQWQEILKNIAVRLTEANPGAALALVLQATNNPALAANQRDLQTLANILAEAGRLDQRLLESFRPQKDQEIEVVLTNGPEHLVIRDVRDGTILAEKIVVVSAGQIGHSRLIRLQDLSTGEKQARLGTNLTPQTALMHGLAALNDGNLEAAEIAWGQAGPLLAAPLKSALQERKRIQMEERAGSDFARLLRFAQLDAVGLPDDEFGNNYDKLPGCEVCLAALAGKQYPPATAKLVAQKASDYLRLYGRTALARTYAPVLAALQQPPALMAATSRLPQDADEPKRTGTNSVDGAAVRRALLDRNPGMAEINISLVTGDDGLIVRAEIIAPDLKDIGPLSGLPDLRAVVCAAIPPDEWSEFSVNAPLADLTPLKGLPLQEVWLGYTKVKDLSPLAGMRLTKLDLTGTRVTDLAVLKGMPLRELNLSRLAIRDVKSLSGLPLEALVISHTEVSDLAPLAGMKLRRLAAGATRIRDITALAGMPLKVLNISRTDVSDLGPLLNMSLEHVDLSQTRVRDLTLLASLPLRSLKVNKTSIRDLSPLRQLALESLSVRATRVKDLEPLRDMPLKRLDISESAVRDLTPIRNSPIEEIWLDYNPDQQTADTSRSFTAVLQSMPRLQKVNGKYNFRERRRRE